MEGQSVNETFWGGGRQLQMVCESLNKTLLTTSSPVQFVNVCVCVMPYSCMSLGDLPPLISCSHPIIIHDMSIFNRDEREPLNLTCILFFLSHFWSKHESHKAESETLTNLTLTWLAAMMLHTGYVVVSTCVFIKEGQMLAARKGNGDRRHVHSTSCKKA